VKKGFRWFDKITAVFVILTGAYLSWYWFAAITERKADAVMSRVEKWQTQVAEFLQDIGAVPLAIVFVLVVVAAFVFIRTPSRGKS
jgi:hypothetical protein